MSNREWRCVKVGIPSTSSLWALLSAEKEYGRLLTVVTERVFDKPTEEWLCNLLDQWPVDVTVSPTILLQWYGHLIDMYDIDSCVRQLAAAAVLQAQLDKVLAQRNAHTLRLVRSMQRDLNKLRKMKAASERAKRKRKKLLGRR
jgi:hypothetical protein